MEITATTAVPGTNVNVNSLLIVGSSTVSAASGGTNYTINVGSGSILETGGGTATLNSGTINFSTAEGTILGNTNLSINSVLTGSGGLTDSDTGTVTLGGGTGSTNGNTYTGATTMNAGTLLVTNVGSLSNGPVNLIQGSFGTTVTTTNFAIANPINLINSQIALGNTNRVTLVGPITLTGTNFITGTPVAAVLAGVISDGASGPGGLSVTGGDVIIPNSQNTYSGGTLIGGGTVQVTASSVLSGSTLVSGPLGIGTLTIFGGGSLASTRTGASLNDFAAASITLNNNVNLINSAFSTAGAGVPDGGGNITLAGTVSVTATNTLSLATAQQVTITGQIVGAGIFGINGGGNLSFLYLTANSSSWTGGFDLNNSSTEVIIGNNGALGTGVFIDAAGIVEDDGLAAYTIANEIQVDNSTAAAKTFYVGNTGSLVNGNIVYTTTPNTLTLQGLLHGSGSIAKFGPGNLVLTNADIRTGTTAVSGGTLTLSGGAAEVFVAGLTINPGAP